MAYVNITAPTVDKILFKELAADILETLVHGDTTPFKDMKETLETYLDGDSELDPAQRAGIYADFLKDAYSTINQQALTSAMTLLKANADYELSTLTVEIDYNTKLASLPKVEAESIIAQKKIVHTDKEYEILTADKTVKDTQIAEQRAKLKKQYGVTENVVQVLGDGTSKYKQFTDGIWYKVNVSGLFVDALDVVTITPNVDGVIAEINAISISSTLEDTVKPGALDKQIRGYDMVNIKDALKTCDERAALMQNAKIPETPGDKLLRKELLEAITSATITVDANNNIDTVTDIIIP